MFFTIYFICWHLFILFRCTLGIFNAIYWAFFLTEILTAQKQQHLECLHTACCRSKDPWQLASCKRCGTTVIIHPLLFVLLVICQNMINTINKRDTYNCKTKLLQVFSLHCILNITFLKKTEPNNSKKQKFQKCKNIKKIFKKSAHRIKWISQSVRIVAPIEK